MSNDTGSVRGTAAFARPGSTAGGPGLPRDAVALGPRPQSGGPGLPGDAYTWYDSLLGRLPEADDPLSRRHGRLRLYMAVSRAPVVPEELLRDSTGELLDLRGVLGLGGINSSETSSVPTIHSPAVASRSKWFPSLTPNRSWSISARSAVNVSGTVEERASYGISSAWEIVFACRRWEYRWRRAASAAARFGYFRGRPTMIVSSLHQADRSQIPLYAVEFPNAAPSVYGSTISSAHTDTYTDADSEHRPSRSRSQSSADLDYADLRARIHQEEQAVQALMEQPDQRPARRATTNPPMAEVPVHRFGTPSRHWRPAEVAKLEELLGEFGTAWQAIWNDNYIGWTKGPKSDWIHPGRDAKKYRYKARNMKIQIMSAQEDVPIYLADVNLSRAELNRVAQGRISHASARGPQSRRPLPQSTRRTGHYTRKFEQSLFRIPPSY
ncbi:uncharacterized protein N7487_010682 [Penicillium crustosum]|uniref:uncharacterized protein n=2 Tax=Penicillium crustosum TaxID=36656 RepID=UPI0023850795|nr:uncharacterized protein N7487_010682 [Penicillium crustosum]KAJ5396379.1 hypothetical protein N7487_010682 [Penicillium crustosum]